MISSGPPPTHKHHVIAEARQFVVITTAFKFNRDAGDFRQVIAQSVEEIRMKDQFLFTCQTFLHTLPQASLCE